MSHVTATSPDRLLDPAHRLTTAGLFMLVTFVMFEGMAVATAMPTAVAELDGLAWYGWTFSAYLVASVVGMVLGGDIGDRRGSQRALLTGVGLFAAGLLVAGIAGDMALFVAARGLQGVGGGMIVVSLYVVAGQAYRPALRPALFAAFAAAWVMPALVGPLIAGLVTEYTSWRLVFLGLLPMIAAGLLLVLPATRRLPIPSGTVVPSRGRRWWALLAGLGIGVLQYAGQRLDLVAIPIAVLGGIALVVGLRRLLPAGTVLARPGLPAVIAGRGLLAGAFFGMDVLLPLVLTQVHGYSPAAAGIPLSAGALGWAGASQVQSRLQGRDRAALLRLGFLLVAVGIAGTALIAVPGVGGWPAYVSWAVAGLGMGLGMPSLSVLLLDRSPEHRRGADSAAFQIGDVTGSALCIGVVGVLVAAATAGILPLRSAVLVAVAVLTGLAVLGALVAPRTGQGPADPAAPPVGSPPATTLAAS